MKYYKTGGELNVVNEKYYINSIRNFGFGIMDFIEMYKPETPEEVAKLIAKHTKKTIPMLGKELYDAQKQEGLNYTLEDCIDFEYTLFCINSIKGINKEKEAVAFFNQFYDARRTPTYVDSQYSIDILLKKDGHPIAAIQVKPDSYKTCSDKIKNINKYKNGLFKSKYKVPVYYLYYNNSGWSSLEEIKVLLCIESN